MNKEIILQELERVRAEVRSIVKTNSLVFVMYSDLHSYGIETESTAKFVDCLGNLCNTVNPTAVVNLGDNFAMLGREKHIETTVLADKYGALLGTVKDKINCPLLLMNGNHDALGTDFFKPQFWFNIVNGKYDDGLANRIDGKGYYYVDFDDAKTRLVFMSVPSDSDLYAEHPTPFWKFGEAQLKWLDEIALNTDYKVLLFSHVPFFYKYTGDMESKLSVWNGEYEAKSYISALCGWIDDAEDAAKIVKAKGNVLACFSGHVHIDFLREPYEVQGEHINYLPCRQVVIRNAVGHSRDGSENVFEMAIDIMVYDPIDNKIEIVRFGDGKNRKVL
ncbi:MAG: metallophosphoesterase [Clostridia bacterium]|nr:metallophosphoesterase [Clostridia bacterium]